MVKMIFAMMMLLSFPALATSNCPSMFYGQTPPSLVAPLSQDQELCFDAFAIGYNYKSRTALYSAEHLTATAVQEAKRLQRDDNFHEEEALPENARAVLSDYRGSGFDRGHLSPNADMPTKSAQYQSFSLSNMVPQLHVQNAGIWADIESTVRGLALANGQVYIVTGGIYDGTTQHLKSRVPVPNATYKAVYVPKTGTYGVYVANIDSSGDYQIITPKELASRTGINPFPGLSGKASNGTLPAVSHKKGGAGGSYGREQYHSRRGGLVNSLFNALLN